MPARMKPFGGICGKFGVIPNGKKFQTFVSYSAKYVFHNLCFLRKVRMNYITIN